MLLSHNGGIRHLQQPALYDQINENVTFQIWFMGSSLSNTFVQLMIASIPTLHHPSVALCLHPYHISEKPTDPSIPAPREHHDYQFQQQFPYLLLTRQHPPLQSAAHIQPVFQSQEMVVLGI